MPQLIVNILGTVTAGLCAVLLLRAYTNVHKRLLLWCGLCFAGLTAANALLVVDLNLVPDVSLYRWRLGVTAGSLLLMLYGLVFESDQP
jgi:fluoride ion exporter CrcB/FEX